MAAKPSIRAASGTLDGAVVAERVAAGRHRRAQHRSADQSEPEHAHGCLRHAFQVGTSTPARSHGYAGQHGLISDYRMRPWRHSERPGHRDPGSADTPDGFGVAVVREDGKWRCSPMSREALTSLTCRGDRVARIAQRRSGVRAARHRRRVLPDRAPGAVGHPAAAVGRDRGAGLRHRRRGAGERWTPISRRRTSRTPSRSRRAISACWPTSACPTPVLSVILDETDLYADEQLGRIAREMGFAEELAAVLDRLDR